LAQQEPLSSVNNAIRILREFTNENDKELGITELSQRLGLAKSTIFRLVITLSGDNLVEKNTQTQKYHLGLGAFELGFAAYHGNELRLIGYPLVRKLMLNTRWAVHLGVYGHGDVVFLCKSVPEDHKGTISKIGKKAPGHCTASGKILLAHQSDQEIFRVMEEGLTQYTKKTIIDPNKSMEQLRNIRKVGYAVAFSEYKEDICSVAVPVYNDDNQVIAAIGIATVNKYLYPLQVQTYVKELKNCSRLITERLI
jgi:IclR family KDG regulon transcriptional repressor